MRFFIFLSVCAFVAGIQTQDVSVMEGDSVTLSTGHKHIKQRDRHTRIKWYFNDIQIAQTIGSFSKICIYDQCKKRFRNRLKLNSHTGDLTITSIRTSDAGLYKLQIISRRNHIKKMFNVAIGVFAAERDEVKRKSVKEGESVILDPGVLKHRNDVMTWYFNDTRIAVITGDQSKICTDDQCKERFRDRLKLNHQTGSLTITNTTITDSGDYKLQISSSIIKRFSVTVTGGVSGVDRESVYVMEGDSVTLQTGVIMNQQNRIKWYFNYIRIAQVNGDLRHICTDVQCNEGTDRFKDRLKLDHQTGSLTITDVTKMDTGLYILRINSGISEIIFSVFVHDFPASVRDEMKRKIVKEGESVTLDPGVIKNPNYVMRWHLNYDLSFICTHGQCTHANRRFRDTLKLDKQTGSLIITNIRAEHAGHYHLKIINRRSSIIRSFSVTVIDSGRSSGPIAGIQYVLLLFCWLQLLV